MPRWSAVYIGHSPFFVLGRPVLCPDNRGVTAAMPATSSATTGTARIAKRFMGKLLAKVLQSKPSRRAAEPLELSES